ncbi:hypothetical protein RUM44_008843 [Polyplax serrata]|uniref:Calcitonin receptor n=1 Tax=Polyplax serrata TaxID=468196 RepID=A0ABR1BDJ3_POLSC
MDSCILCYRFMSNYSFKDNLPLDLPILEALRKNYSNYEDLMKSDVTLSSFLNSIAANKWKDCCINASNCCSKMLANKTETAGNWCPRTWDGWLCWPDIPAGKEEKKLCPSYALTNMENCTYSYALKTCDHHGKWAMHPFDRYNEWTNYTPCSAKTMIEKRMYVSIGSYALSILALLPALIIFQKFRSLRCHRIILHKNLFASLLLHCSTQIAFNAEYVLDDLSGNSRISKNEISCKVLLVATKYFRLTNYLWMFCEGFYLHRQIVNVFAEEANLAIFYIIGWGVPIIPVVVFTAFRNVMRDSDCWALPSEYIDWALYLPCLLSLLINAIFLINIVTVLIMKLRTGHLDEHTQFRKAVKATLVLVPLFGIHFLFTLYRQKSVCSKAEEAYAYIGSLFDGLQGFLVAIMFCYINSERLEVNATEVVNLVKMELDLKAGQRDPRQKKSAREKSELKTISMLNII